MVDETWRLKILPCKSKVVIRSFLSTMLYLFSKQHFSWWFWQNYFTSLPMHKILKKNVVIQLSELLWPNKCMMTRNIALNPFVGCRCSRQHSKSKSGKTQIKDLQNLYFAAKYTSYVQIYIMSNPLYMIVIFPNISCSVLQT